MITSRTITTSLVATIMALAIAACGGHGPSTEQHGAASTLPHAEAAALLRFVNDADTTVEMLDIDCRLRADAARNIIAHRNGPDGVYGQGSDNPFDTIAELDGVSRVGPVTMGELNACAVAMGFTPSPADLEILNFVNAATTTLEFLDIDCALRADSARNIIAHRDGPDGVYGTADDNLFDDMTELDGVYRVGPATLASIIYCLDVEPTEPTEPPAPTETYTYVSDLSQLDPVLAQRITTDLMQVAGAERDRFSPYDVHFAEVKIRAIDGVPFEYTVTYVQMIDPEGGIQLYIDISLDASYNIDDVHSYI